MAKILLFGQAQFGLRVLDGLLEAGHEITAVCPPPDREGKPLDPVKERAVDAGIRVVQRKSYKPDDAYDEVRPEEADLGVLAFVTQIIPRRILDAPRFASVCYHPSLLPKYRGGAAINWQLINGETKGGFALFRPDDGVDSGPVYLVRELEIGPDETSGSYYYGTVFEPSVAGTLEVVEMILAGKAEGAVQDEELATDDPLCRDEHAGIDWSRPAGDLHNLVRGCDPSPGAHATFGDTKVRLFGSRRAQASVGAAAGQVVSIGDEGIEVATGSGTLRFKKMNSGSGKKPASEAAAEAGIEVGETLSNA